MTKRSGYREETIQVNTVSTTLLALLLLPWLKQYRSQRSAPAHLVLVGSGTHLSVDIKPWPSYIKQDGGVIAYYAKKENFPAGQLSTKMYGTSKLLVQYAIEEMSKLTLDSNGKYVFLLFSFLSSFSFSSFSTCSTLPRYLVTSRV